MRKCIDVYFTTATIRNWYPLLSDNKYKDIVIDSMRFIVNQKRATIWAFVIMSNHIHIIWQILHPYSLSDVRRDMLKFISQSIKNDLIRDNKTEILENFTVNKADRYIQIWKRNPLSIEIVTERVLQQKLKYIHRNMQKKGMSDVDYKYSSAFYYETDIKNWDFL